MQNQALALSSIFFLPGFDERAFLLMFGMFGAFFFNGPKIDDDFVRKMEQTYPAATMDPVLVISDKVLHLEYAQYAEYGDMQWTDTDKKYAYIILDHKLNSTRLLHTWMMREFFAHLAEGGKFILTDNLEVLTVITK